MATKLDDLLDDALADFGSPPKAARQPEAPSAAPALAHPEPSASGSRDQQAPRAPDRPAFDPLGKAGRRKPQRKAASPQAPPASRAGDAAASSSSGPRPGGSELGAVPPDIAAALDGDMGQRLSQLMAELAQMDLQENGQTGSAGRETSGDAAQIADTLQQLAEQSRRHAGAADGAGPEQMPDIPPELAGLLNPDFMARMGAAGNEGPQGGGMGGLAESLMQQLLSKDVLEQPMREIGARYPSWLQQHRNSLAPSDRARYEEQYRLIQQITAEYAKEPNNGPHIFELIQAMQACGNPPQEIVNELSPGLSFDQDGLPAFGPDGEGSDAGPPKCVLQ